MKIRARAAEGLFSFEWPNLPVRAHKLEGVRSVAKRGHHRQSPVPEITAWKSTRPQDGKRTPQASGVEPGSPNHRVAAHEPIRDEARVRFRPVPNALPKAGELLGEETPIERKIDASGIFSIRPFDSPQGGRRAFGRVRLIPRQGEMIGVSAFESRRAETAKREL